MLYTVIMLKCLGIMTREKSANVQYRCSLFKKDNFIQRLVKLRVQNPWMSMNNGTHPPYMASCRLNELMCTCSV
jgi:hypothetical protein